MISEDLIEDVLQHGGTISEGFGGILYNYYSGLGPGVFNRPVGPEELADSLGDYPNGEDLDNLIGTESANAVRAVRARRRA